MSFLDNIFTLSAAIESYLATLAGAVDESGRIGVDIGGATFSGDISAAVSTESSNGTLAATNDVISVAMEGRPYAGFSIGTGFTGTITFEASFDNGTTWSSVQTYTAGLPPTITGATLSPAGSAASVGLIVPIGATTVRARVSSGAGSALASIRATVAGVMHVFPQLTTVLSNQSTANSALANIASYLNILQGAVTSSRMAINLDATDSTYLANLTNIATYLNTLQGAITSARMQVDLASTPTANLATLAGAITSARMAVNVDSTTTGKLDTLHADLGTTIHGDLSPASTVYDGNKNVTTAGTRVALAASQALTKGVRVRGKDANTGLIYIGGSSVSSSSDRLAPGEPIWMDINNLANVYIDAAVSGEGVTFSGW